MSLGRSFIEKTAGALSFLDKKSVLFSVLCLDLLLLGSWGTMFFNIASPRGAYSEDLQSRLTQLRVLGQRYEQTLIRGQAVLADVGDTLKGIADETSTAMAQVKQKSAYFDNDPAFTEPARAHAEVVGRRLEMVPDFVAGYADLHRLDRLLNEQLQKTVLLQSKNNEVPVAVETAARLLTESRLRADHRNRDAVLKQIAVLFRITDALPPTDQGKVYLFLDTARKMTERLRVLDLLRNTVADDKQDTYLDTMIARVEAVRAERSAENARGFFAMVGIGVAIMVLQTLLASWVLAKRAQFSFLEIRAAEAVSRSEVLMSRARRHSEEAHRTQFQLLSGFCLDFRELIDLISKLAAHLRLAAMGTPVQYAGRDLANTVGALQTWIHNYIHIHEVQKVVSEEVAAEAEDITFKVQEFGEKLFSEVRYYGFGIDHKSALCVHKVVPESVHLRPADYDSILRNALLIALKFADGEGVRLEIDATVDDNQRYLCFRFLDLGNKTAADVREQYEKIDAEGASWDGLDRFIIIALGYCRQLLEPVGGSVAAYDGFDSLGIEVRLPYRPVMQVESDSGLDGDLDMEEEENPLFHRRILIVSPYEHTRAALMLQLKEFGALPSANADKYAAVGMILDNADDPTRAFNAVLIEHYPPEIDAVELVTKLRSVMGDAHLPVLLMSGQAHYDTVAGKNAELYRTVLSKPVLPSDLHTALKEAFLAPQPTFGGNDAALDDDVPQYDETLSRRVIIYEPDDLQQIIIQAALQESGHEVTVAEDENEILTLLNKNPYDILLFSEALRGQSIISFMNKVRDEDSKNSTIAAILMARNVPTDREMRKFKVDDVLLSPPARGDLSDKIREWSDPTQRRASGDVDLLRRATGA